MDQRLPLTAEMVPHRLARRIRRDCWRELRCEYRYQHINQYVELKYRTPLTQEVLEGLKKCFPRGMLPTWAEIEARAARMRSDNPEFTRAFRTPSIGVQFSPLMSIKTFTLEAFLRYEAGYLNGIIRSLPLYFPVTTRAKPPTFTV